MALVTLVVRVSIEENYLRWYAESGSVIALVFAFVARTVDLDQEPELVAAEPNVYLGAWLGLVGGVMDNLGERMDMGGAPAGERGGSG